MRYEGRFEARPVRRVVTGTVLAVAVVLAAIVVAPPAPAQDAPGPADEPFLVGRGIADVTGEAAEVGMMGYADLAQTTTGVHQRQRARSFVIADRASDERVAFVVADIGMIFQSIRDAVLERLASRYGDLYSERNVMLTATHTHGGPGGYAHHTLYNFTTFGYHGKTFDAIVDGIVRSVVAAHDDLAPASLRLSHGELHDASANRSMAAFARNPAADRAPFPNGIDPRSTLLQVVRDGEVDGVVNWFATHGTSMRGDNRLITGDNKGYAQYHWERQVEGVDYLAGASPSFVAAFAQSNAGDMTPNLALEPGHGPTDDEFENTRIIGQRQFDAARRQLTGPASTMGPGVDSRLTYVDVGDVSVRPELTDDGQPRRTCAAALGASFAAGSSEDWPGPAIFNEGAGNNPFFDVINAALYTGSPALRSCQAPKSILLPVGALGWVQQRLPVQLVRIGDLYLVGVPFETTVVSGLRLRRTVAEAVGADVDQVVVQGYANAYAHYLTTPEEYDAQEYEGGSTLFGRATLPAVQQVSADLGVAMREGTPVGIGTRPPDRSGSQVASPNGVVAFDAPPLGRRFGAVVTQPAPGYERGQTVTAAFAGAHPNNDQRRGSSFLLVEHQVAGAWRPVADDGDWSTTFHWARWGLAASRVTVTWEIPPDAAAGTYRIRYQGDARGVTGRITPISGTTQPFTVRG